MDLVLRAQLIDGVPVLSLHGEVDLATVPRLHDGLTRALTAHPGVTLVLDLDGLGLLDDVGLGVLLGARRRARATGGDVVLVTRSSRLVDLLRDSGLATVMAVFPSVTAAVRDAAR